MTPKPSNEDADKYGYEDPDAAYQHKVLDHGHAGGFLRTARRSSMKQEGARRRASIQTVGTIEIRLPGHSEPVQRRTSIDFNEKWNVEVPTTVADPNDLSERWMAPEEYDKIEKDNHKIVKAIEKGTDKNFCTRGLEGRLTPCTELRDEAKQVVWDEQQRQKQEGSFDESKISDKYRMVVLQAKIDAVERAEQDNADIESYLKSTRKMIQGGFMREKMMRRTSC